MRPPGMRPSTESEPLTASSCRATTNPSTTSRSENDVEPPCEVAVIRRQKPSERGVARVGVHVPRVEVIGDVEATDRQPDGILARHLNVFGGFEVERHEAREARRV